MNLKKEYLHDEEISIPRVSGGEPEDKGNALRRVLYSPRERG